MEVLFGQLAIFNFRVYLSNLSRERTDDAKFHRCCSILLPRALGSRLIQALYLYCPALQAKYGY